MKVISLANNCATRYDFIDEKFAEIICQVFEITLQRWIKSKKILKFDSKATKSITHAINSMVIVCIQTKSLGLLLRIN